MLSSAGFLCVQNTTRRCGGRRGARIASWPGGIPQGSPSRKALLSSDSRRPSRPDVSAIPPRRFSSRRRAPFFCFLKNLSELRILTTFYPAKNDHQWVNFISPKTIMLSPVPVSPHIARKKRVRLPRGVRQRRGNFWSTS